MINKREHMRATGFHLSHVSLLIPHHKIGIYTSYKYVNIHISSQVYAPAQVRKT